MPGAKRKARKPKSKPKSASHPRSHPYKKPKVKPKELPRLRSQTTGKKRQAPSSQKNIIVRPLGVRTPLEGFFSRYPNYQYQPSNSPVVEFDSLCKTYCWKRDDRERKAARKRFQLAMREEFDSLYGSDEDDINNWHKLCHVLRIDPLPPTLHKCRDAVLKKHVNLVDLVHGSKVEVRIFATENELSEYTRATQKFFPKEAAVDGGVLRALRRHILAPRDGTRWTELLE